jgi:hypothetical protein
MQISPSELTQNGYLLLDELDHKALVPFVQTYIKKHTWASFCYYLFNLLLFACLIYLFIHPFEGREFSFWQRFTHAGYGMLIAFALLPLHEYIHVLAYRSQGAKNTSYAANLKKFYFMALAHEFVANRKAFKIVALAPFLAISILLTVLLPFANPNWLIILSSALLMHTAMCSGDFGLLSYFEFHKDKEVVTYDDVEKKVSYFYGKGGMSAKQTMAINIRNEI